MAITRRQFVTRLGALAAALGMSQADLSKVTEAFAHGSAWSTGGWTNKPKVIWVHGAECTGCSTSLLSLFEDVTGKAVEGTTITTLAALDLAVGGNGDGGNIVGPAGATALGIPKETDSGHPFGHRTLWEAGLDVNAAPNGGAWNIATIADVLVDFIDLQYHETVMGMGGDLAYQWLKDNMAGSATPFVLVVEGAIQDKANTGYWNSAYDTTAKIPWCSIGQDGNSGADASFDDVVLALAGQTNCAAVVSIGQCACFGGYPACVSPVLKSDMTGALGTYDFLVKKGSSAAGKVINVPGCPTNPWWFVLTVVAWLVDFTQPSRPLGILKTDGSINDQAVDKSRRLKIVYGSSVHGPACPRYKDFTNGLFAQKPGDPGCLQLIGCKGPSTLSLCPLHGWNSQQPHNDQTWDNGIASVTGTGRGSFCVTAGHPCMGCTEKGYPDAFVPFVAR